MRPTRPWRCDEGSNDTKLHGGVLTARGPQMAIRKILRNDHDLVKNEEQEQVETEKTPYTAPIRTR